MSAPGASIFDDRPCDLGEGPLWHPVLEQLFWFDITAGRMLSRDGTGPRHWQFEQMVSAAGWIGPEQLLIASETALLTFDLQTGATATLVPLESGQPETRSNDGRADPWGGFWIGTMGKSAQPQAGAIYRYARGELRRLVPDVTIPNGLCFDADRACAYYTDTPRAQIMRLPLGPDGWPVGAAVVILDLAREGLFPDGAVTDAEGNIWIAQWGAGRVACYSPQGAFLRAVPVPGQHSTCPAFGGPDLRTLMVTSARQGLGATTLTDHPENGMTFAVAGIAQGKAEPQVHL